MELKILQVNAWTGRVKYALSRLIQERNCDVVCLQEAIWDANHTEMLETYIDTIDKIKKDGGFEYEFRSSTYGFKMLGGDVVFTQGNVILSKIPFKKTEEKTICGKSQIAATAHEFEEVFRDHSCNVQKVTLENGLTVFNYHGYWLRNPFGDSDTVKYMKAVAEMIKNTPFPVVLCGDLNIITESPAMRELDFLQDLTATNHIKNTLHPVKVKEDVACDHILISDGISCQDFKVLEEFASDHKALEATLRML